MFRAPPGNFKNNDGSEAVNIILFTVIVASLVYSSFLSLKLLKRRSDRNTEVQINANAIAL